MLNVRLRLLVVILLAIASKPTFAQTDLWKNVGGFTPVHLKSYVPTQTELARIQKTLLGRVKLDDWPCAEETDDREWTRNLVFEELPISINEKIVLVEAGQGCARGGQGANGAMWVLRFRGDKFSLIATPQLSFNGWLYAIQETSSHGFRDLVLGWHMSAREGGLTYFRFDGTSYQAVGQATYLSDDDGSEKIIPKTAN